MQEKKEESLVLLFGFCVYVVIHSSVPSLHNEQYFHLQKYWRVQIWKQEEEEKEGVDFLFLFPLLTCSHQLYFSASDNDSMLKLNGVISRHISEWIILQFKLNRCLLGRAATTIWFMIGPELSPLKCNVSQAWMWKIWIITLNADFSVSVI